VIELMQINRPSIEISFKDVFNNLNDAVFLCDPDGKILEVNDTACKRLGYSHQELLSMNIEDIYSSVDRQLIGEKLGEVKRTGHLMAEASRITKSGKTIPVEINLKLIANGEATRILSLSRDISLRKEQEEKAERLNEALQQQKLYEEELLKASKFKTEFLATMSHELRTPLNPIIGFTDLLLEGAIGELNEEQEDYLRDIKSSAQHQHEMIDKILDITKIESGRLTLDKQVFSLQNILDQVHSAIKPRYEKKGLAFEIEGLDENMEIYADPIRFRQILLNLLTNAIKYTIDGKITLLVKEKYDRWVFKVRDTGIGIAREDFEKVFKEFQRADSSYVKSTEGTGLGLSLTKRLVELHNGSIDFTSVLGMGTTFTFVLPKKPEDVDVTL
jgi:PAS domain S-box-containing protein